MANPGFVTFQKFAYPHGLDKTGKRIQVSGYAVPVAAKTVIAVTAWSVTGNVFTFTAANTLAAGNTMLMSGFATGTFLNGLYLTVISATSTTFTAVITQLANGNANPTAITQALAQFATSATENGNAILFSAGAAASIAITSWSLVSNIITFQAVNTLVANQVVQVSGLVTGAFANSTPINPRYLVVNSSGLTGTAFACNLTYANGSATENGTASIYPTYSSVGLPCVWYPQTDLATGLADYPVTGGVANPIPRWGSPSFASSIGIGYDYGYDPVHNTLRIVSDSTAAELASGVQVTGDLIVFNAEFAPFAF